MNTTEKQSLVGWFNSAERRKLTAAIQAIPWWRRFLISSVLDRKTWREARAFSVAAISAAHGAGPDGLFDVCVARADALFAELYGVTGIEIPTVDRIYTRDMIASELADEIKRRETAEAEVTRLHRLCTAMRASWAKRLGRTRQEIEMTRSWYP